MTQTGDLCVCMCVCVCVCSDEQKTPQQKARVDILVQDLLGIVDERDKVERKKMSIASKRWLGSHNTLTNSLMHQTLPPHTLHILSDMFCKGYI